MKTFTKFLITTIVLINSLFSWGQTNPAAQSIPFSQDFSALAHNSTTYPSGFQGWTVSTSPGATFNTSAPTADKNLTASSTSSTNSGNVHNYNGKIGFLNSSSLDLSIVLALNTTGKLNIQVSYDAMTIRNPYDGTANTRINEMTLQYRVGTSGAFTTLTGIEYQNNTTNQTTTAVTTPQNSQTKSITLPSACNNQSVVQIRWISRQVSGTGGRPSFAVDNISVSGSTAYTVTYNGNTNDSGTAPTDSNLYASGNTVTVLGNTGSLTKSGYTFNGWNSQADGLGTHYAVSSTFTMPSSNVTLYAEWQSAGFYSVASGDWNTGSTWNTGTVPTSTDNVLITSGDTVYTASSLTRTGTTTVNGAFQLNAGGWASGTNFTYDPAASLLFNNTSSYGVNSGDVFWPVTNGPNNINILQGGLTLNSGANRTVSGIFQTAAGVTLSATLTLSGTCQINSGGYFNNAPTYTGTSTLVYNGVTGYGVYNEWTGNGTTAGVGIPQNITLTNSSVNMPNANRGLAGNLNIESGSTLSQHATSGDLYIAGNWTNSGTYTPNNRAVFFNGASAQTLTGATTFDWLFLNNTNGLTLNNSVVVNSTVTLTSGKITLQTNDLTAGSVSGGSTDNYIVTSYTSGQLKQVVGASNVIFPVGNSSYNPITLSNSGTSDLYGIRVAGGQVTTAYQVLKTVKRKWYVSEAVAGGSNLSVVAQYRNADVDTGFNAGTYPFIGFYNVSASTWTQVAATLAGSDPFTATSNTNTTPADLSTGSFYFAVGKDDAFLAGVATKFVITAITPTSPSAGENFSVTVSSQDFLNVNTNVTTDTSFTLSTNGNAGAISGTVTGTILSGTNTITVSGVVLASPGTNVTVTATQTSGDALTAGTSSPFEVLGPATQLAFVNFPTHGYVSTDITSFTIEARRADNSVDLAYTGNITLSIASGTGNLAGTITVAAVNGVATFSAVQFDTEGIFTVYADSGSLTQALSNSIDIDKNIYYNSITGTNPNLDNPYLTGQVYDPNITVSGIGRGSGIGGNAANDRYNANNFTTDTSVDANDYFYITLTPNTGYFIDFSSLFLIHQRNSNGPTKFAVRSSVDSFTADLAVYTNNGSNTPITETLSLAAASFDAITSSITFQIYGYTAVTTAGTGSVNEFDFYGKVKCIQPTAYTVTGTGSACAAIGVPVGLSDSELGMNYQLKRDGSDVGSPVAGTGNALAFGNQTVAGTYTVVATNTNGSCNLSTTMSGNAVVSITPDTTISTHPISQEICVGQPVTFTVVAANSSTYSYQWKKDGVTVGTDSDTFTIATTVAGDAGNYTVDVLGECGAVVTSNVATLSFTPQVITWANLETPTNGTNVLVMGQDFTIQSQVYIECVTDGSGDDSTLHAWIGYNTSDTNPATWTNWVEVTAPYTDLGNNFRFSLSTQDLLPSAMGTYYIAARYQYDNGAYKYGGYSSGGGHFWDGVTYVNGKLEVQPISLFGDGTSNVELDLYSSDGIHFSTTANLSAAWVKFKQNHAWTINWGSASFPSGTGVQDGANIPVSPAGTYLVTFNKSTGAYSFTNIDCTSSITTTWNGSTWDNGTPDMNKKAVFDADYNTSSGAITACECQINTDKTVTVADDTYLTVSKTIVNNGSIVVESQGNVIQYEATNSNTGSNYLVKKTTSTAMDYDYIYWTSPVSNANIATVFSDNPSYRYQFVTGNFVDLFSGTSYPQTDGTTGDGYDDNGNDWTAASGSMSAGKGYIVMAKGSEMPINSTNLAAMEINAAQNVEFTGGVFNNGTVTLTALQDGTNDQDTFNNNLNFIGNPYPSAISADRFINTNTAVLEGTLYFWTHKTAVAANAGPNAYDFNNADFATYTLSGGVASANGGTIPTGNIASCQGFMASVKEGVTGNIVFNNLMRLAENNNNFYRQAAADEKDRLWLKMTGNDDLYRQILIAFLPEATVGVDTHYDGLRMYDETTEDFYSVLNHQKYAIQAYPAFDVNYEIPLGIQIKQAGTYSIDLDGMEGILEGKDVYLEDTENEVIHNLKSSAYSFTSTAGNFDERFILRFTDSALSNEDTSLSQVKIYPNPSTGVFYINYAGSEKLTYTVYDLTGKKVLMGTGTVMDLSSLNSGIYTAQISNTASVRSVKLIRE